MINVEIYLDNFLYISVKFIRNNGFFLLLGISNVKDLTKEKAALDAGHTYADLPLWHDSQVLLNPQELSR